MGWTYATLVFLLVLTMSAQCQQTAESWNAKGLALEEQNKHDEAVKAYDEALKLDPNLTEVWFNKGIALFYKGEYRMAADAFAEAIKDYDEAIKLNPNDYLAWFHKGEAIDYSVLGRSEYSHDPDASGAYEQAVKACDEEIEQDPNDAIAWNTKGLALSKQDKYDEAIQAYDKAIEINPQYAEAWYNKGNVLSYHKEKNSSDEEIQAYDKAIEINPRYTEAWYNKGIALSNLGKYDDAVKAYDRVIELDPQNAEVWYVKGHALKNLGKYNEAIKAFDKTIETDPLNWVKWDDKAVVQKEMEIKKTYYLRDFFTDIDGRGVTFFLSFMGTNGEYATPEGKLLIVLYKGRNTKIHSRIYNITKEDYGSYVGGIAIQKWISFEEMSGVSRQPSKVTGRFGFQDTKGVTSTAKEETQ